MSWIMMKPLRELLQVCTFVLDASYSLVLLHATALSDAPSNTHGHAHRSTLCQVRNVLHALIEHPHTVLQANVRQKMAGTSANGARRALQAMCQAVWPLLWCSTAPVRQPPR